MQRVTFQLKCPNPLFEEWLSELQASSAGTPVEDKYVKALDSLRKYPLVLNSGSECAILKGFTKNLCKILDRKLCKHNEKHNLIGKIETPLPQNNGDEFHNDIEMINDEIRVEEECIDVPMVYENGKHSSPNVDSNINIANDKIASSDFQIFDRHSFDVILIVDKQETNGKVKQSEVTTKGLDNFHSTKYELRHLTVGDFLWIVRHKISGDELVLPYIVERKRMDDLEKSIKDGRYHEQKFRLKQCGLPNVIYLLESNVGGKRTGLPYSTLTQAVTNTRIQNGFMTHYTESLTDSMKFLAMMTKHLTDHYSEKDLKRCSKNELYSVSNSSQIVPLMSFEDFNASSVKNKTLDVSELFIKQLLQVKGISIEKALAIVTYYKTPLNLMRAYENRDQESGESMLQNIIKDGKKCSISTNISKLLYKYFTSEMLT